MKSNLQLPIGWTHPLSPHYLGLTTEMKTDILIYFENLLPHVGRYPVLIQTLQKCGLNAERDPDLAAFSDQQKNPKGATP